MSEEKSNVKDYNEKISKESIAKMIDHTLLKPTASEKEILTLCNEAKENKFASVCVNPRWLPCVAANLYESGVKICTVVGFPLGANSTWVKAEEAAHSIFVGADEIDMVADIGSLLAGCYQAVKTDIETVVLACRDSARKTGRNVVVKVIIETCYLSDEQIKTACRLVCEAGADFVKTSTGFGVPSVDLNGNQVPSGATVHAVELMSASLKEYCPDNSVKIKAAGGIKSAEFALQLIKAGASRIGTSSGIKILSEL